MKLTVNMDQTAMLWILAFVMLIGSYLAGSLPLVMNLSEDKLQIVSVFGAGLLVGTALAVIIPEGINALFTSVPTTDTHAPPSNHDDIHRLIGISLVLGFLFMLLVDQCSSKRSGGKEKSTTATIGLVVHAAADGIALGAAATTSQADVEIIVFLAIMLHKAPASFALVSFLLHEGLERKKINRYLIFFSMAAPVGALVTYLGIGQESKETLSNVNATGIAMLFSAGTFLYVATVHVLPELMSKNTNYSHLPTVEGLPVTNTSGLKFKEIVAFVVGALVPTFITTGHHH